MVVVAVDVSITTIIFNDAHIYTDHTCLLLLAEILVFGKSGQMFGGKKGGDVTSMPSSLDS